MLHLSTDGPAKVQTAVAPVHNAYDHLRRKTCDAPNLNLRLFSPCEQNWLKKITFDPPVFVGAHSFSFSVRAVRSARCARATLHTCGGGAPARTGRASRSTARAEPSPRSLGPSLPARFEVRAPPPPPPLPAPEEASAVGGCGLIVRAQEI